MTGNVEDDAVRILELALEISLSLVAEVEEELAAGLLDAPLRLDEIVDLEAEMIGADDLARVVEVVALLPVKLSSARLMTPSLM